MAFATKRHWNFDIHTGLEAFIQVALREMDKNHDDVITVEELESWFEDLEEEVEEGDG